LQAESIQNLSCVRQVFDIPLVRYTPLSSINCFATLRECGKTHIMLGHTSLGAQRTDGIT
jgi:hypothetical protein